MQETKASRLAWAKRGLKVRLDYIVRCVIVSPTLAPRAKKKKDHKNHFRN